MVEFKVFKEEEDNIDFDILLVINDSVILICDVIYKVERLDGSF